MSDEFYLDRLINLVSRLFNQIHTTPPLDQNEHPNIRVIVANTHLLFNPKRGDVKLLQVMKMISRIEQIKKQSKFKTFGLHKYNC